MNPKTFDQIEIKKIIVGEKGKLLTENLEVSVSFYNDKPISVELPNQVKCKIDKTDVALKVILVAPPKSEPFNVIVSVSA